MRNKTLLLGKIERNQNGSIIDGVEIMGMFEDAWRNSVQRPELLSELDHVKKDMKELTKAHYDSLKKWKILKEQNEEYEKQIKEIKTSLNNILKLLEEVRDATDKEHLR